VNFCANVLFWGIESVIAVVNNSATADMNYISMIAIVFVMMATML
jgi:hypothetical protein